MFDEILQKGVYKKSYFVILEHAFLRNPDYTTTEKMVYLDLMGYAGQANSAFPSKSSIAKDLGICNEYKEVISHEELEKLSEKEYEKQIENYTVYARVTPLDKVKIVKKWQEKD